jgi:hypothetical protein
VTSPENENWLAIKAERNIFTTESALYSGPQARIIQATAVFREYLKPATDGIFRE